MKHRRSLYKYFSERRWAEAFLDGQLLFRSLAYFRDHEEKGTRGDENEGRSLFHPDGGLVVNNETQGKTFTLPGHALASTANQEEIFVFCVSRSLSDQLRDEFGAGLYVEILNIPEFCAQIESALPSQATLPGRPGHTRIGHRVAYYRESEAASPRWALPDLIATSKLQRYARQDEFRLVFSLTDALGFENVKVQVLPVGTRVQANPAEHRSHLVKAASLRDICRLHEF